MSCSAQYVGEEPESNKVVSSSSTSSARLPPPPPPHPLKVDYFFDFPDDYELGDGGEFDLDGIITAVPGVSLSLPLPTPPPLPPAAVARPIRSRPLTLTGPLPTSLREEQQQELKLNFAQRYYGSTSVLPGENEPIDAPLPYPGMLSFTASMSSGGSLSSSESPEGRTRHMDVRDEQKTYSSLMVRRHAAEAVEREKRMRASGYSNGKNRLKLEFINLGGPGESRQGFGRKSGVIPDGLHGTNEVYSEKWEFMVTHTKHAGTGGICLEWKIINSASRHVTSRIETPQEAHVRRTQGRTVCNHVVREALDHRAGELERAIATVGTNALRIANLQSRSKALRPRRCLIGLLFFGLLHDTVQDHMALYYGRAENHLEESSDDGLDTKRSHDDEDE
jgi:hypothetical protein